MTNVENKDNRNSDYRGTSVDAYLQMNEREKDLEIQKAVERLQKRIQAILYVLESDRPHVVSPKKGRLTASRP